MNVNLPEWVPTYRATDLPDEVYQGLEPLDGYGPAGTRGGPRPFRYGKWWLILAHSDFGDVMIKDYGPYHSNNLPGMTADKLRQIADYITSADGLVEKFLFNARENGYDVPDEALQFVAGKAMQHDLRAWADVLDSDDVPQ